MPIYFFRHGQSVTNVHHIFAGQRDDAVLTDYGRVQVRKSAEKLKEVKIDLIVSSTLLRARHSAEIIAGVLDYPVEEILHDKRIVEYDMGELTGTPARRVTSAELIAAKDAEDPHAFHDRVLSFLNEYRNSKQTVLMVSHADVGRMIATMKHSLPIADFYDLPQLDNAQFVLLDLSWLFT